MLTATNRAILKEETMQKDNNIKHTYDSHVRYFYSSI